MPEKVLKKFSVSYLQVLDEDGNCDENLKPKELTEDKIKEMYELMVISRILDKKMLSLQRQGRLYTFAPARGQEASDIGSAFAMEDEDWMVPYFRNWPAYLARGLPMENILQYNAGDERGMKMPNGVNCFPICIPVGTQIPHAAGLAWGLKKQGSDSAVVCYLGDGATSEGDFNEGMNFAGAFDAPAVFICENNQYAISVPVEKQTGSDTLAQKGIAYGMQSRLVDGNDVFAMYKATKESLKQARQGNPVFIEAYTYRLADHTTSDDASRYRTEEEVKKWEKKDPIKRLRKYMEKNDMWTEEDEKNLQEHAKELVNDAVEKMEDMTEPNPEDMFDYMYGNPPSDYEQQKAYLKEHLGSEGGEE